MPQAAGQGGQTLPEVVFEVLIEGDTSWSLVRTHLSEGLSELYECALELARDTDVDPTTLVGKKCVVVQSRDGVERRLCGIVVSALDRGWVARRRVAEVTVAPALWLLGQRVNYRIFQEVHALKVVEDVLADAGLYQGEGLRKEVDAPPPLREYCTQYGESDLDFVRRLLEEEGLTFHFEHKGGAETLVITNGGKADAFPPLEGYDVLVVMGAGGANTEMETIRTLERGREVVPTGARLRDYDFTHPDAIIDAARGEADALGPRVGLEYPGRVTLGPYNKGSHVYGDSDARRLAPMRLAAATHRGTFVLGRSNVTGLLPGRVIEARREDSDVPEKLLVVRVTHTGEAPEVLHLDESAGGAKLDRYANHFEAVAATSVYRPLRVTPKPRALTPQSAVVVAEPKTSADTICTDHHGRIKARFQWDRIAERPGAEAQKNASCWMRTTQAWAGQGWGFMFLPRVGMEVMVQFLDADPDRPVVTGCLYNATHAVPETLPDKKTRSTLRTQSTPGAGFNELSFEDASDQELVYIKAQKDLEELVLHDHRADYKHDETVHVGNDQTFTVDHDRKATVTNDDTLDVVKNRSTTVGENDTLEVNKNLSVTVFEASTLTVSRTHVMSIDEGLTIKVGGNSGSKMEMKPESITLSVGAAKITLDASAGVKVEYMGQSVALDASSVKIAGVTVSAQGQASAELKSTGIVTVQGTLVKIN